MKFKVSGKILCFEGQMINWQGNVKFTSHVMVKQFMRITMTRTWGLLGNCITIEFTLHGWYNIFASTRSESSPHVHIECVRKHYTISTHIFLLKFWNSLHPHCTIWLANFTPVSVCCLHIMSTLLPVTTVTCNSGRHDVRWQGHALERLDLKWSHEVVYGVLLLMGPF